MHVHVQAKPHECDDCRIAAYMMLHILALSDPERQLEDYDAKVEAFQKAPAQDWEGLVAARRTQLTADFFAHLQNRIRAGHGAGYAEPLKPLKHRKVRAALHRHEPAHLDQLYGTKTQPPTLAQSI